MCKVGTRRTAARSRTILWQRRRPHDAAAAGIQHGIGSGVIISPNGYIVTNNHVVDGATQIRVTLHDRRVLSAKVIGVDKLTDLAVIKVDARDLPAMSWGDSSKLEPGRLCSPLAVRSATSSSR